MHKTITTLGGAALLSLAMLHTSGCSDTAEINGCVSNLDCRAGRVCAPSGACVDPDDPLLNNGGGGGNNTTGNNTSGNNTAGNNTTGTNNVSNNENNPTNNDNNGPIPGCPPDTVPWCADDATVVECVDGGFVEFSCAGDERCEDGACVAPEPPVGAIAVVTPRAIDYGRVPFEVGVPAYVTVTNAGQAPLTLVSVGLESPSSGFSVDPDGAQNVVLEPRQTTTLTVTFRPTQLGNYGNRVVVVTDAPETPELFVDLEGISFETFDQPCLFSSPDVLDFGDVAVGDSDARVVTVGNCSTNAPVTLTGVDLDDDDAFDYTPAQTPATLNPGDLLEVPVSFSPPEAGGYEGEIVFESDSPIAARSRIELRGSAGGCGETVATVQADSGLFGVDLPGEFALVPLLTPALLEAGGSTVPSGAPAFAWTVAEAPGGSTAQVQGSSSSRTFTPDVPGEYVLEVEAYDAGGAPGQCDTEEVTIYAVAPSAGLQATLSWDAPHDMDLHVLRSRPDGTFPQLTSPNDLYYEELQRDWGVEDDFNDDGFHLGDDTDGFGPESAVVLRLEPGRAYQIVGILTRPASNQSPFTATVEVSTTDAATGTAQGSATSRDFTLRETGTPWVAAEVAADGTITTF